MVIWTDEAKFEKMVYSIGAIVIFLSYSNPQSVRQLSFQDSWCFNVFCVIKSNRILAAHFTTKILSLTPLDYFIMGYVNDQMYRTSAT